MSNENKSVTLINIFSVEPQNQQELIDIMVRTAEQTARYQPGFISAHLYRGVEGNFVANYVQWRSKEDLDRMKAMPEMKQHVEEIHKFTRGNAHVYELCNLTEGVHETVTASVSGR